jgi:cytochrome P450
MAAPPHAAEPPPDEPGDARGRGGSTTISPGGGPQADDREALRRDPLGLLAARATGPGLPRVRLGAATAVLVARPELVREVLVERLDRLGKPEFSRASNRGHWGEGLTTLEGQPWRARRGCVRGAFGPERVRAHRGVVRAHALRMVEGWRVGEVIDLRDEIRRITAASAVRFVLGAEVEGWGDGSRPPPRATVVPWAEAYGEDFTAVGGGDVPLALTRPRAPVAMPVTVGIIDEAIGDGIDRGDALSWLVAAARREPGAALDRDAIVGELVQMLFAGHHTVPTTMLALARVLAGAPAMAQRARAEPEFLELVLLETMRMFPPAPILYREVIEPFVLAGESLEAGTGVWICVHVLHRDPRSFESPERFLPERFAADARARVPTYAYLPFGAGPRTCIAQRLAMAQMVEAWSVIAREHALRPCGADRFVVERVG